MTREQFIERAIRTAERAASLPRGWWGSWRDATNGKIVVRYSSGCWRIVRRGALISKHDSREHALRKADRL